MCLHKQVMTDAQSDGEEALALRKPPSRAPLRFPPGLLFSVDHCDPLLALHPSHPSDLSLLSQAVATGDVLPTRSDQWPGTQGCTHADPTARAYRHPRLVFHRYSHGRPFKCLLIAHKKVDYGFVFGHSLQVSARQGSGTPTAHPPSHSKAHERCARAV